MRQETLLDFRARTSHPEDNLDCQLAERHFLWIARIDLIGDLVRRFHELDRSIDQILT